MADDATGRLPVVEVSIGVQMNRFPEKRVVITGGVSGLGLALARHYAARNWHIVLADIQDEMSGPVIDELSTSAASVHYRHCNVASASDFADLAAFVTDQFDGVDLVINNAGVASSGSLLEADDEEWDRLLTIDLKSVAWGCKMFLPSMISQRSGHFVNIASFAGIALSPGMMTYNVAKAGVIALSETLRGEVMDHGIGVTVVCPAFFKTNLVSSMQTTPDQLKSRIDRWMENSGITAEDVADQIDRAVAKNRFLLLTHRDTRRMNWMKRLFPEWFFNMKMKRMRMMLK